MKNELQNQREDYAQGRLDEDQVQDDPIRQFELWYREYKSAAQRDPNAMTLATANDQGKVSARTVLLKGLESKGFEFYTNYESSKAEHIEKNPQVALLFFWPELERQVRVEGKVEKLPAAASDEYFNSRPEESKLGAWASPQSQKIPSRSFLEKRLEHYRHEFGQNISRPPEWGGYRVVPDFIEFWQGRFNRLHDRLLYERTAQGTWSLSRLAP